MRRGADETSLGRAGVHLRWAEVGALADAPGPALDRAETERLRRIRVPGRARAKAALWRLRRRTLSELFPRASLTNWTFRYDPMGCPEPLDLPGGNRIHLSLSTTDRSCAVLLAPHRCGIDIEAIQPPPGATSTLLLPHELTDLEHAKTASVCFTRLWTAKEAGLKLLGQGFRFAPKELAVFGAADEESATGSLRLPDGRRLPCHWETIGQAAMLCWVADLAA